MFKTPPQATPHRRADETDSVSAILVLGTVAGAGVSCARTMMDRGFVVHEFIPNTVQTNIDPHNPTDHGNPFGVEQALLPGAHRRKAKVFGHVPRWRPAHLVQTFAQAIIQFE